MATKILILGIRVEASVDGRDSAFHIDDFRKARERVRYKHGNTRLRQAYVDAEAVRFLREHGMEQ